MGESWQITSQMYEQLFQKPKMTQKLLDKPPFRYLHDIFTATMGATGFGDGLFGESELDSKGMTERDQKIGFLSKLIALCELMTGEKIDVKPAKIVAGLEADKTNGFLQVMFQCATSGVSTTPYIQKLLGADEDEGEGDEDVQKQEEMMRLQQEEEERKKHDDKKRRIEEKKKREQQMKQQQEEDEERQRQEMEAQRQRDMMEEKKKRKQQKRQPQTNIIKDEEQEIQQQQEEQEDQNEVMEQQQQFQIDPSQKHGVVVEEAMKLMKESEEQERQREEENTGPKIKLGKIGQRKKQSQEQAYTKQNLGQQQVQQEKKVVSGGGFSDNDIEFMKKAIQILCQSTNPLGKSIDFVTDDIDSMSKEYDIWKRESISCQSKLEEQQRITEEVIQPLQDQVADLEERIREQVSKITSMKSQIMRNDITIQNLLYSVISTR